jgi:sterol desaturase/sphingolipid hydroxylase (fatty acid hydroxylase superfamily)
MNVVRQLLLFIAVLSPLELLLPAHRQGPLRRGSLTDLLHFAVNPLLISAGFALLLTGMAQVVPRVGASQPWALQFAEIFVLSELGEYWVHRLSHTIPLLWRFHAVHHSNVDMDFLAAHRQHPLEAIWLLSVANLPIVALGFDVGPIAGFILFQKLYTAFLHANVRIGYGRFTVLLASPQFHHWHHDVSARGNFSSTLPLLDKIFGSYTLPAGFPARYGCDAPVPTSWWGQLLRPLLPSRSAGARSPSAA